MFVKKYQNEDSIIWNEFVSLAKNSHFFFLRKYMDYHSSRFIDHSLMIYDDKNSLIALLPANISGNQLISHQGLTFGGLLIKASAKQNEILSVFKALQDYLSANKLTSLTYKRMPYIYHEMPCDEDLYALFRVNAKLIRRDVSSTIKLEKQIKYSKGRKWIVKKASESGMIYQESTDINSFWSNLTAVLQRVHGVNPVHTVDEIKYLHETFPKNIKFYTATLNNEEVSGAVIFEVGNTVHTQYLFNSELGRQVGALDGLIDYLVKNTYADRAYFDFGISNEDQGRVLNEGLISQKEGFGARAVVHDFYEIYPGCE
ncbi:GNAT family N-acetyltransferase [Lelliottia wanjuensis]|uniref:GNAT family N-acetyltransferase n=1 Tax=Lelliottia wanjuensis TaxID=3050585 RepID=A0AAP4CZI0_9ENTR|nr:MULTISPECIES: GNAT family N-acetyltransferase [unclassified Lelliottia]MDK9362289.1 GNAT family N-acetyltransferase [Lelliottia sp. V106_12]MDK9616900.1 GNAT family N-acetyltransferase [Lelliottia sp. V106_9]